MANSFDNSPGKIFIGGIAPTTTQDSIQKYFEQYGELCDCVLMQDKASGKSRCFGFVTYKDANILDDVLSKKHVIDGKEIDCKRAIPREQQTESGSRDGVYKTKKLFVGGLTQTTTEEQFKEYFEQFGAIEDSVIMVDKDTGKSRGFGFVTFDSEDAVDRVIEKYNDNKIDGKWVECKKAQAKDTMPPNASKKGGRPGGSDRGGGRDYGGHSRHSGGRDDRGSRHGGYYQSSPPSSGGGHHRKSSRSHGSHDNYGGGGYQSHGPYPGKGGPYGGGPQGYGGPGGYNQDYGYGQNPYGQDPYGYAGRGPQAGYSYGSEYGANYNAQYPGGYQGAYNPAYAGGYPQQYNPATYGQQGYDPTMAAAGGKPGEAVTAGMGQATTQPTAQYGAGGAVGYGADAGYNQAAYGYNAQGGDYSANGSYPGYNPAVQAGAQGAQPNPSAQTGGYPKQGGQSDVGPVKGGAKKQQGVESRYYQPY